MMDIDQSQRRDIDNIQNDKISLTIDDYNVINSPLNKNLYNFMVDGYNWIKSDNRIFKYNLVENDKLVFHIDKIDELFEKIITNIKISFEIENGNNNFIFNGVNLVHDDIIKSKTFNEFMNKKEMVFNCGTFNYSDLDFIVNGKEFDIELLFNGNKSNSMFSLKNVYIIFEFVDKLINESDTVVNRLEPQIDFYRDENGDLILQIGDDASGKGMDREDRNIVDWFDIQNKPSSYPPSIHNHDDRYYTESEMDTALNTKQDTLISGTNIKTINNNSLLGNGNINIQGGGSVTIDSTWITGSTNPAESQLIQSTLEDKTDVGHTHNDTEINSSYTNIEMGTLILATLDDVLEYNEPFTRINRALEHMLNNWEDYD